MSYLGKCDKSLVSQFTDFQFHKQLTCLRSKNVVGAAGIRHAERSGLRNTAAQLCNDDAQAEHVVPGLNFIQRLMQLYLRPVLADI